MARDYTKQRIIDHMVMDVARDLNSNGILTSFSEYSDGTLRAKLKAKVLINGTYVTKRVKIMKNTGGDYTWFFNEVDHIGDYDVYAFVDNFNGRHYVSKDTVEDFCKTEHYQWRMKNDKETNRTRHFYSHPTGHLNDYSEFYK